MAPNLTFCDIWDEWKVEEGKGFVCASLGASPEWQPEVSSFWGETLEVPKCILPSLANNPQVLPSIVHILEVHYQLCFSLTHTRIQSWPSTSNVKWIEQTFPFSHQLTSSIDMISTIMTMVTMTMMVVMLTLLLSPMVEQPSSNSSKWSERHFFANCLPVFLSPVSPVPVLQGTLWVF